MATHFSSETRDNRLEDRSSDIDHVRSHKITSIRSISLVTLLIAVFVTILTNTDLAPFLYRDANESIIITFSESQHRSFSQIFILIAYYGLFSHIIESHTHKTRINVPYALVALLFAFFMVEGQRYAGQNSLRPFAVSVSTVLIYALALASWFVVFLSALVVLDEMLEHIPADISENLGFGDGIKDHMSKNLFTYLLLLLLIILIPISFITFPGQFMGDSAGIIAQGFNIEDYLPYWSPNIGGIKLGNHHPIAYTMLLHYCIVLGKSLFGSYNNGIYIAVLLQIIISAASFAYCITVLHRSEAIRLRTAFLLALFYGLNVQVQLYLVLISKDALYAAALLFFLTSAYGLCHDIRRKATYIIFACSIFCVVLFRNDGIYVVIPTLIALLAHKDSRRISAVLLPMIIVFWLAFGKLILPFLGVAPGSKREMLSIPFQQTARCLVVHPEDVSESERAAIDGVLVYDEIALAYDPNISDPVKNLFREEASSADISCYFMAWMSMLTKHPATYVYAVLNNKFKYFYPNSSFGESFSYEWSEERMELANQYCEKLNTDFHHLTTTKGQRLVYEGIRNALFHIPLISALITAPFYLWVSLILLAYTLNHRHWKNLILFVPVMMIFIINLAGPTNGNYFRYTYPIMLCLPVIIASTIISKRES